MEILDIAGNNWVQKTIRGIGGFIDRAVYSVVEVIMQLIMDLSNTEIFSQSVIDEFATRIYIILGLVMVFKLMVSFIQILVNPDKMDDKEQGVTGVLKRAVISLVLIFMVPSIFDLARQVQGYIIPVIPKVLLGVTIDTDNQLEVDETMSSVGRTMAFYSFLPFFTYSDPNCDGGEIMGPMNDTSDYSIWSVSTAVDNLEAKCDNSPDGYKFKYSWPLSSIVGIYLLFVLIQVAIAIAIRAIKLGICEFVAPIPIASYIDPKSSKQAFDTWVKTSVQVYLDLFIRLIVVYFVVFIFMTILNGENLSIIYSKLGGDVGRGALVTLFIILGLLQFVKQAPKFICDILGFKGSGDIAGMFKGAWGMAGSVGAVGLAGYRGLRGGIENSRNAAEGRMLNAGRAISGLFSAGIGTVASRLKGKSIKESVNTSINSHLSKQRESIARTRAFHSGDGNTGVGEWFSGVMQQRRDNASVRIGTATKKAAYDYTLDNLNNMNAAYSDAIKSVDSHKLSKYYKNQYLAAQNVGLDAFEKQVTAPDVQRRAEITKELSSRNISKTRRAELKKEYDQLGSKLGDVETIRNKARMMQAEYVNKAQKDYTDAQKRLVRAAYAGNTNALTRDDITILGKLGLDTTDKILEDGHVLENVGVNLHSAEATALDRMRDDSSLKDFIENARDLQGNLIFQDGKIDLSNKDFIDSIAQKQTQIKNSPEYYRAQFTDSHKDGK